MPKEAGEFVAKLAQDTVLQEEFEKDPDAVMDAHGVPAEDKEVLKTKDPEKIKKHLGGDGPPGCMVIGF